MLDAHTIKRLTCLCHLLISFQKKLIKRMVWHFTGPYLDPHWLILYDNLSKQFKNRSDRTLYIDCNSERYTSTVINLFDLVTAISVVMPEEYFLEYSSD